MDFNKAFNLTNKAAAIYYSNNMSKERYAEAMVRRLKEELSRPTKISQASTIKKYMHEVERQTCKQLSVTDLNGNISAISNYLLSVVRQGLNPSEHRLSTPPSKLIFERYITKGQGYTTEFVPFKNTGFTPIRERIRGSMVPEAMASLMEAIVDHKLFLTQSDGYTWMFFLTPDITIDHLGVIEINFGRFIIGFRVKKQGGIFESIVNPDPLSTISAKQVSEIVHPNYPYIHPHISIDGTICMGEGGLPFTNMLRSGLFYEAIETVISVLKTYNSSSPYQTIDRFERVAPYNQKCCITKKFIPNNAAIVCPCGRIRHKYTLRCACHKMGNRIETNNNNNNELEVAQEVYDE